MIESLFSMQDKICVVTGCSRGLRAVMVQGFLESGAKRVSPGMFPDKAVHVACNRDGLAANVLVT